MAIRTLWALVYVRGSATPVVSASVPTVEVKVHVDQRLDVSRAANEEDGVSRH